MGTTSVDPAALRAAAQRMDAAADIVNGALRARLGGLQFDASVAGRAHAEAGGSVRTAVDRLAAGMAQWAMVARETAAALSAGADRYADAESHAVAALR
jgi:hypothetical protein